MNCISIILPVKNTAIYLEACLDSIVAQDFTHWELIAVDDASSDHSLSLLQKYAQRDTRIHVLSNPNPGLLEALRFGYSKSTGTLIHRMDSDDIMPTNKLQLMHNAWQENGMGSLITGGTEYFSDHGEVGDGFKRYDAWLMEVAKKQSHRAEMYRECVIPSNCWLVHREDFDAVGGFEPATFPEDYDLCLRFITHPLTIVGIPNVLHFWRDRPDRISRNWEEYRDNRFFELKVDYFFRFQRDLQRPLVVWGAGKNGKDLVKCIQQHTHELIWLCENEKKIGKDIYGIRLVDSRAIKALTQPQLIIAVAGPNDQNDIEVQLKALNLSAGEDYWFFS